MGGEKRREKSLRIGVHHADGVVWGPVYRTHRIAAGRTAARPYATPCWIRRGTDAPPPGSPQARGSRTTSAVGVWTARARTRRRRTPRTSPAPPRRAAPPRRSGRRGVSIAALRTRPRPRRGRRPRGSSGRTTRARRGRRAARRGRRRRRFAARTSRERRRRRRRRIRRIRRCRRRRARRTRARRRGVVVAASLRAAPRGSRRPFARVRGAARGRRDPTSAPPSSNETRASRSGVAGQLTMPGTWDSDFRRRSQRRRR